MVERVNSQGSKGVSLSRKVAASCNFIVQHLNVKTIRSVPSHYTEVIYEGPSLRIEVVGQGKKVSVAPRFDIDGHWVSVFQVNGDWDCPTTFRKGGWVGHVTKVLYVEAERLKESHKAKQHEVHWADIDDSALFPDSVRRD